MIGISQSGESRDTVNAVKLARELGARTLAITNLMGSQITREAESVLYTRCGLEIGVAASKTFTAQVALLALIGLKLAQVRKTLPPDEVEVILDELYELPQKIEQLPRRRPPDRRDRPALLRQAVLPLPGPAHRRCRSRSRARSS